MRRREIYPGIDMSMRHLNLFFFKNYSILSKVMNLSQSKSSEHMNMFPTGLRWSHFRHDGGGLSPGNICVYRTMRNVRITRITISSGSSNFFTPNMGNSLVNFSYCDVY